MSSASRSGTSISCERDGGPFSLSAFDDRGLADARPFLEDLAQRNVLRDERHAAVRDRELQIAGARRIDAGTRQQRDDAATQRKLLHKASLRNQSRVYASLDGDASRGRTG